MPRSTVVVNNRLYRVRVFNWADNQAGDNVRFALTTSVVGAAVSQGEWSDHLDTALGPLYAAIMSNQAEHVGLDITDVTNIPPYLVPAASVVGSGPGTVASALLPTQVCGLLTLNTDTSGQGFRGRVYLPFPAVSAVTALPPVGCTVAYQGAASAILAELVSVGTFTGVGGGTINWSWVLKHGPNKVGFIPLPSPITGGRVSKLWATQRRRGAFGRPNPVPIP